MCCKPSECCDFKLYVTLTPCITSHTGVFRARQFPLKTPAWEANPCRAVVLAPVVQEVESAIHWIPQLGFLTFIRWIAIYPVGSAIQRLNNWGQDFCHALLLAGLWQLVTFVRTHPYLGVPVVKSHKFSRYHGRLPIGQHFLTSVERPLDTLWSLHNVVFLIVLD